MELRDLNDLLQFVVSILGVVIPLVFLIKENFSKERRSLRRQLRAFYCLEEEAAKLIQELEGKKRSIKTIKSDLRNRAASSEMNNDKIRPSTPDFVGKISKDKADC